MKKLITITYRTEKNRGGYVDKDTYKLADTLTIISGYLVEETADYITLAQGYTDNQWINLHQIYKGQITQGNIDFKANFDLPNEENN